MSNMIKLGDIANITKLAGFEHTKYIQGNCTHEKINSDDVPLFIGKTVRNGKININFDWYISKKISDTLDRSKLSKKCIVIPYVGTVGDLAIYDGSYSAHLGSNIAKIELNDNCGYTEEFIYYFLKSPYGQTLLLRDIQGAVQKNITMQSIRNIELPIININEQKKIVESIKCIDDKIENNNKINEELETMAKTIYDYWFLQFEFPNEEGKPYKSSGGKMVWNEELKREIPEGWEVGNLYDIADFINGLACQKFRPIDNNKMPVVKITEMHDGITENTEFVRSDIPEKNIINNGDILFSWSATLETMIWNGGKAGLNQHIFKVMPKNYPKYYVYMQLSSYIINFIQMALARKTTMGHITTDHLKQSKIVLPPKSLTKKYNNMIENQFLMQTKNKEQNKELTSLRDFLLPLLMNGQVGFKEVALADTE